MNPDKSVSIAEHGNPTGRTGFSTIPNRAKFENVEKLSNIVRQMEQNSNRPLEPQHVLQVLKTNIKTSYNKLYDNYQTNRNIIMKNIQYAESNDANEGAMKQKFQNVLKEKNTYDKLKSEVEGKQKKLKKLIEMRDNIKLSTSGQQELKDVLQNRITTVQYFQQHRNMLDYETAVLDQMKKQRDAIKLKLKERYENMVAQNEQKAQRAKRLKDACHTKKMIIQRIEEKINQEDYCEIPQSLEQQLQKKLQQYEGKYMHENILIHQKILSEQKTKREKYLNEQEQQLNRKVKLLKEKQDKRELQIAENHILIKKAEQEQIKRLCRVQSIADVADGSIEEERRNLLSMQKEIQDQIQKLRVENKNLRKDMERILTNMEGAKKGQVNLFGLEKELQDEQSSLRRLKTFASKKQQTLVEWQSILQLILKSKGDKESLIQKLEKSINKYENFCVRQKIEPVTAVETKDIRIQEKKGKKMGKSTYGSLHGLNQSSQVSGDFQF